MTIRTLRHPRAVLAATMLGSSVAFIDGSVVTVALPALAADLHADAAHLSWAINAYLLPLGALILLGGGLGDHFGRRRWFLLGLSVFTLASVLCAVAPTLRGFLAGRALQGLGAAALMPNSLAILGASFEGEERGRAIGTWASAGALAGALGPVLGGWMVDGIGWRSLFLLNVPVAAAAGYLAWKYVEERRPEPGAAPLDAWGGLFATAALGSLTWALSETVATGRASAAAAVTAVAGTTLMGLFLWHEHRLRERALMPFALFSSLAFLGLTLLTFFLYGSLGGLLVLLPFLLIRIEHWSAVAAGAALLPVPVAIGLGSRVMGRVAARIGGRLPLSMGCLLVATGLALYAHIGDAAVGYWSAVFPATLLVALGMGACVAPLTTSVMESVDRAHVGIASGFNSAVARIAGLVATALLGFAFARQDSAHAFMTAFRFSAWTGAASAVLAGGCALALLQPGHPRKAVAA